ncbi:MAG: ABC transporter permease [Pseudomonadota bacterium]
MNSAIFRALLLGLLRDRGALLMSFALPAIFFVILAEIFSASSGNAMTLRTAVLDEVQSETTQRLVTALEQSDVIQFLNPAPTSAEALKLMVRTGDADVGLILRKDSQPLEEPGFGRPPILIVFDPARGVTEPVLTGQLRQAYFSGLPDVALGNVVMELENQFVSLTSDQRAEVDEGLREMKADAAQGQDVGWSFEDMLDSEPVAGGDAVNLVAYSAGAVAFMFLLFAAVHGALSILDEEENGIIDRVLAGPGGIAVLVNGKFAYVILQGFVQVSVIFLVAWLFYGVDLPRHFIPWLVITLAACISAAGLAMLLATACRTRRQAQTIANTLILILSAIGGSMVPRFLMPASLRDLGWLTPNTWALEAYSGILWREDPFSTVLLPTGLLLASGIAGWLASLYLAHRRAFG